MTPSTPSEVAASASVRKLAATKPDLRGHERNPALDATKGMLVVFMVLYHSFNYSTQYHLAFKYLSFLPPSFILITGFLLSHIYLSRHDIRDLRLHGRLITRGVKLLVLFTALNVAAQMVYSRHYHNTPMGLAHFFENWPAVYLHGHARLAVFEILLPICYLLLLAPALLWLNHWHRFMLPILAAILLAVCAMLERQGLFSLNLSLISAGVLGMWIGRIPMPQLNKLGQYLLIGVVAYGGYAAVGLIWGQLFLLQLVGACIALAVIYGLSVLLGPEGWTKRRLVRLGQYSLLSYIAQIGILQVLSHFFGRPEPASLGLLGLFLGTLIPTALIVEAVAWSRRRVPVVNGAYQAVFA